MTARRELHPSPRTRGAPAVALPPASAAVAALQAQPLALLTDLDAAAPGWCWTWARVDGATLCFRYQPLSGDDAWFELTLRPDQPPTTRAGDTSRAAAIADAAALRLRHAQAHWPSVEPRADTTEVSSLDSLLAVLAPVLSPSAPPAGGWRLHDASEVADGWLLELRNPDHESAYHVRVAADLSLTDYLAGPGAAPSAAAIRGRVLLALGLAAATGTTAPDVQPAQPAAGDTADVLTRDELVAFERDGYLVLRGAVPRELTDAVISALRWFLALDPSHDGGWTYDVVPYVGTIGFQRSAGFLELYQHQALWGVRQHPVVHRAFAQLWGREDLWVSMDRVGLKVPEGEGQSGYAFQDPGRVHWDVDVSAVPLPFGLQGLVALTDASAAHGTFHCAPGAHRQLERWVASLPPGEQIERYPPRETFEMTPVPLRAGDLLIWHEALPHRTGRNTTDEPRLVQYLHMFPARPDNTAERLERLRGWRDRLPGASHFEGDPLQREALQGATATLTPLGRRLLGLDPWPRE